MTNVYYMPDGSNFQGTMEEQWQLFIPDSVAWRVGSVICAGL